MIEGLHKELSLKIPSGHIGRLAWSPDGQLLAAPLSTGDIAIWDTSTGQLVHRLKRHKIAVTTVAWYPQGNFLCSGSHDGKILVWHLDQAKPVVEIKASPNRIHHLSWSEDGKWLACGSDDYGLTLWGPVVFPDKMSSELFTRKGGQHALWTAWDRLGNVAWGNSHGTLLCSVGGSWGRAMRRSFHAGSIMSLAFANTTKRIATAGSDSRVVVVDFEPDQSSGNKGLSNPRVLEGHVGKTTGVVFSDDDRVLFTISMDNSLRAWCTETWTAIGEQYAEVRWDGTSIAMHSATSKLAAPGKLGYVDIYAVNTNEIVGAEANSGDIFYRNARVLLVGDSGVGKSGLGIVLSGREFEATPSTHGRQITPMGQEVVEREDGTVERRETLLWDLAGQPGYRIVHQLHLNEAAVILLVVAETGARDPLDAMRYWCRALDQGVDTQTSIQPRILVVGRRDCGGLRIDPEQLNKTCLEFGIDHVIETSAKEGWGISDLGDKIRDLVHWQSLPVVTSNELFLEIRKFIERRVAADFVLTTKPELYLAFIESSERGDEVSSRKQFYNCVRLAESSGLVLCFAFGDIVLLQPERLDAYAATIVQAAADDPDGLGSIREHDVLEGSLQLPADTRVDEPKQERLLLIATIEDLLRRELAVRESAADGPYLVFPSQSLRSRRTLSDLGAQTLSVFFEGSVEVVFATLVVRLRHAGIFGVPEVSRSIAMYKPPAGGLCSVVLKEDEPGKGQVDIHIDADVSSESVFHFESFVTEHISRRATIGGTTVSRLTRCSACNVLVTDEQIAARISRGFAVMPCPGCDEPINLSANQTSSEEEALVVGDLQRTADTARDRHVAVSRIQGKKEVRDFDVFLSYNSCDVKQVEAVADALIDHGLLPWLDVREVPPGGKWQQALAEQITTIKSAIVFLGGNGMGPWQTEETMGFLRQFSDRHCPVIPVFLAGAPDNVKVPFPLDANRWVDLREPSTKSILDLVWGITGDRPVLS